MSYSVEVKGVSLSALFIVTFTIGLIPLILRRKRRPSDKSRAALQDLRRSQIISLSACFAGGAFFASITLDLLPEVQENFQHVLDHSNISTKFPVAEFGISIGFFLILTLEQIIHVVKEGGFAHGHGHGHIQKDSTSHPLLADHDPPSYGSRTPRVIDHHPPVTITLESGESDNDEPTDRRPSTVELNDGYLSSEAEHVVSIKDDSSKLENEHGIIQDIREKHQNKRHYLRSFLLLIALSVHSLFEGLAIGLFQNIDNMIQVLGAVILHKCILGFSISINLVQHKFSAWTVAKSSFIFSVMSPVGFGIGILMLVNSSPDLGMTFCAMFQAIATGTFLYVTFFEIFFHELNSKECHKLLKVLMIVLGFSVVALVNYLENDLK